MWAKINPEPDVKTKFLIKIPMATAMTEAFHVKINIAPAPKKKLNSKAKVKTLRLLKKIFENKTRYSINARKFAEEQDWKNCCERISLVYKKII